MARNLLDCFENHLPMNLPPWVDSVLIWRIFGIHNSSKIWDVCLAGFVNCMLKLVSKIMGIDFTR